jgi:hypothetical protein
MAGTPRPSRSKFRGISPDCDGAQTAPSNFDAKMKEMAEAEQVDQEAGRAVSVRESAPAKYDEEDPLRRLTATSYVANLPVMGRTVRLETNSSKILDHIVKLFARYPGAADGRTDFLWRIVSQSDVQMSPPWPKRSTFSDHELRFAEFGQRNFVAVDIEAREAIAFISEGLAEDAPGFTSPFLDNLFCLTVSSLGLVPLWANCVAREHRGVLLFGEANNGKTSASYVAEKLGLDFQADEGAFIELDSGVLRSWGGFWPATLRPKTLQFFPELKQRTRPCFHRDFVVYHLEEQGATSGCRSSIQPLCCLFLERQSSAAPSFSRVGHNDFARLLAKSVLFKDDERFREQQDTVVSALEELPAYVLRYGSDPAVAAATARDLLAAQDYTDPGRELLGTQST